MSRGIDRPLLSSPDLSVSVTESLAMVEIRRPPSNFFDEHLIGALVDALVGLDEDPECRVLVLCSAGKHFCAGANFSSGEHSFGEDRAASAGRLYRLAARLFETRKPIIAAVQGSAVGGGLGLACAADFRVGDGDTKFIANFARLGFHHGFGLSVTLPAVVGPQAAADLLIRGGTVRGEEAHRMGLIDRLADSGRQRETAMAWAQEFAAAAPLAVESIRQTLRTGLAERVQHALDREISEQSRLWSTEDSAEGLAASLARRSPRFVGR